MPSTHTITAIGDGSCLIHSILLAIDMDYIEGDRKYKIDKCREVRDALITPLRENYDSLGNGVIKELGKDVKEYSLNELEKLILSSKSLGQEVIELLTIVFDINIIVYDFTKNKRYKFGSTLEDNFIKDRETVVVAYNGYHYDSLAIDDDVNLFDRYHPLIVQILDEE